MAWIRRVVRGSPILLMLGMWFAAPSGAQEPGRVVGRITDGAGNPVRGATLVLVSDADSSSKASTTSGETGGFEFARVAAGTYTLRTERPGFAARTTRLTVAAGERETVIARLRPARRVPVSALRQP